MLKCLSIFASQGSNDFIAKCLFDTTFASNQHSVDILKTHLSNYNNFFTGNIQQDSSECLMLIKDILDKGSLCCPNNGSLSEILFSFILERYITCQVCKQGSSSFETDSIIYISPSNNVSMQQLIMQEQTQKMSKNCSYCKMDTCHIQNKQFLQPPKYLNIIVNRFGYNNNKNRAMVPLDRIVMLCHYRFDLHAVIDHHGYSIDSGHYTASVVCCNKLFYCNDNRIISRDINDMQNSSTAYMILYKLAMDGI